MIRLKDLLESKQVGDIYHFTPLSNVAKILKTQYMIPKSDNKTKYDWTGIDNPGDPNM